MTRKNFAIIGLSAPIIFWVTYFILNDLRPEYNFYTKAISELGSIDAPYRWYWNVFGYIIPGLLISVFSIDLSKSIDPRKKWSIPGVGIFLSGVFMAISGFFPGDFETRDSLTMIAHSIGSFGSFIFFLIGAFTSPQRMKKSSYWKPAIIPLLLFTWMTIVFGSWPLLFPHIPAVGQRFTFFFYFLWIGYTSYKLYRDQGKDTVDSA